MKTASTVFHLLVLSACLALHLSVPTDFTMAGVRRAMQTIESARAPTVRPMDSIGIEDATDLSAIARIDSGRHDKCFKMRKPRP